MIKRIEVVAESLVACVKPKLFVDIAAQFEGYGAAV